MLTRVISAIVLLPFLFFIVIKAGVVLQAAVFTIGIIGLFEYFRATEGKISILHYICFIYSFIYIMFINEIYYKYFALFIALFFLSLLIIQVIGHKKYDYTNLTNTFFAFFYLVFTSSHIYLLREAEGGLYIVWYIFITAWISDTFAYFTGKLLGKHKLIPSLSPNKTIEGSLGAIFFTALLSFVYAKFLHSKSLISIDPNIFIIAGAFASVLSQLGDLFASAIKRKTGVKDFGSLIPGHGGILDRFDSVLFTAPGVFLIASFFK